MTKLVTVRGNAPCELDTPNPDNTVLEPFNSSNENSYRTSEFPGQTPTQSSNNHFGHDGQPRISFYLDTTPQQYMSQELSELKPFTKPSFYIKNSEMI